MARSLFLAVTILSFGLGGIACQSTPAPAKVEINVANTGEAPRSSIVAGATSWEIPLQWQVADSFTSDEGKVTKIHGHKTKRVIVPVSLTNSDGTVVNLHFLVDTGAEQTIVNTEKIHVDLTNAKVEDAEGVGGVQKMSLVTMPKLSVGPLIQENAPVAFAAMPLEEDGLLGQDFLRHFIITIDYQNAIFRLQRSETKQHKHE